MPVGRAMTVLRRPFVSAAERVVAQPTFLFGGAVAGWSSARIGRTRFSSAFNYVSGRLMSDKPEDGQESQPQSAPAADAKPAAAAADAKPPKLWSLSSRLTSSIGDKGGDDKQPGSAMGTTSLKGGIGGPPSRLFQQGPMMKASGILRPKSAQALQNQQQQQQGPPVEYDKDLLKKLGIEHVPSSRIQMVLQSEKCTLEDIAEMVDMQLHLARFEDDDESDLNHFRMPRHEALEGVDEAELNAEQSPVQQPEEEEWSPKMMTRLVPKRSFFAGQRYEPEDLSPKTPIDWNKLKRENQPQGCPLGGKKGPKIDWTNAALLSKYISDGGNIKPRKATRVCAKKQRELSRCIRRARVMAFLPRIGRPLGMMNIPAMMDTADARYQDS